MLYIKDGAVTAMLDDIIGDNCSCELSEDIVKGDGETGDSNVASEFV